MMRMVNSACSYCARDASRFSLTGQPNAMGGYEVGSDIYEAQWLRKLMLEGRDVGELELKAVIKGGY